MSHGLLLVLVVLNFFVYSLKVWPIIVIVLCLEYFKRKERVRCLRIQDMVYIP